jgi:hypothetical protein
MDARECGTCSLCCKVIGIAALDKPAGKWCPHFAKGVGCSVYADAPAECRHFQCYWLRGTLKGDEWKPDRCKMVVWANKPDRIIIDVENEFPNAWRREPYYRQIKAWSDRSRAAPVEVLVRVHDHMLVVFPEAEIDLGPYDLSNSIVSGYRDVGGRPTPFAEYVPATARR